MPTSPLRRLAVPSLALLGLLAIAFFGPGVLGEIGSAALSHSMVFPNSLIGTSMVTDVSQPSPPRRLDVNLLILDPSVPVVRARRVLLAGTLGL